METLVVVWAITHFIPYLYDHNLTVYTDHTAVKAVPETATPSGKHTRWWTKVYGSGVKSVKIRYCLGRQKTSADALSQESGEVQVAAVNTEDDPVQDIRSLLNAEPLSTLPDGYAIKQQQDPELQKVINIFENDEFNQKRARKTAIQSSLTLEDQILFYIDPKQKHRKRVAVLSHLQE